MLFECPLLNRLYKLFLWTAESNAPKRSRMAFRVWWALSWLSGGAELRGFSLTPHILFCSFKTSSGERLILNAPETFQGVVDVVLERAGLCSCEPFGHPGLGSAGPRFSVIPWNSCAPGMSCCWGFVNTLLFHTSPQGWTNKMALVMLSDAAISSMPSGISLELSVCAAVVQLLWKIPKDFRRQCGQGWLLNFAFRHSSTVTKK